MKAYGKSMVERVKNERDYGTKKGLGVQALQHHLGRLAGGPQAQAQHRGLVDVVDDDTLVVADCELDSERHADVELIADRLGDVFNDVKLDGVGEQYNECDDDADSIEWRVAELDRKQLGGRVKYTQRVEQCHVDTSSDSNADGHLL